MSETVVESPWKVWVAFWLAALFWGTSFLWIKLGLEQWDPVSLVAFRLLFASLLFIAALAITKTKIRIPREKWWVLPVVALFNPYLPFLLISWAEVRIDSGVASILNATVPLFTLVLAPFFLPEEKPTWKVFLGTCVGFIGVLVLFSGQAGNANAGNSALIGELAVLLAAAFYGGATILLRRLGPKMSPLAQAALLNGMACCFVWIQALTFGEFHAPPLAINWIAVVWLGALGSFAAYTLAMYVLHQKGAMQVTLINFAYPMLGLLLGILFLGEAFQIRLVVGGLLILGGIALVQRRPSPKTIGPLVRVESPPRA